MGKSLLGAFTLMLGLAALGGALFGRHRRRRIHLALGAIVALLVAGALLAACGSTPAPPTQAPTLAPNPTPTSVGAQISPLESPLASPSVTPTMEVVKFDLSGRIAYHSEQTGDFEIWVMNADGTEARPLTSSPRRDIEPAWSPDGTKIAFASARDDPENLQLYVMNADGSDQRRLFEDVRPWDSWTPAWSPDGTRIAFQVNKDVRQNGFDIYVANADGTDERLLVGGPGDQYHVFWSPDGKYIVYVDQGMEDSEIYIANADGSDPRPLTDNDSNEAYPRWSPDGQWILFQSDRDAVWRLYRMRPDGSDVQRVSVPVMGQDVMGAWSPDGKYVVFSSNRANRDWELYVMPVDGSSWMRLTFNFPEVMDRYPAWTK